MTDDASDGDGVTEYWSSVSSLCDVITLLSKVERPLHFVLPQIKEEGKVQIGKIILIPVQFMICFGTLGVSKYQHMRMGQHYPQCL